WCTGQADERVSMAIENDRLAVRPRLEELGRAVFSAESNDAAVDEVGGEKIAMDIEGHPSRAAGGHERLGGFEAVVRRDRGAGRDEHVAALERPCRQRAGKGEHDGPTPQDDHSMKEGRQSELFLPLLG